MRLLSLAVLGLLLGIVYWVGATVYTDRIEQDIAQRSNIVLAKYQPDVSIDVDGRDVTLLGTVDSDQKSSEIEQIADKVWGVRKTANRLDVVEPVPVRTFDFKGRYTEGDLKLTGLVDSEEVIDLLDAIPAALPLDTNIERDDIEIGAEPLAFSPQKVETGIAALTQLSKGDLHITDKFFVLKGVVSDADRRTAIEQLIDTRRPVLEPLEVMLNITVDPYLHVTQECREAIFTTMQNSTLNYKVDHYNIEAQYNDKLDAIASVVNGVCVNQISQILVEGHADVTGGEGYNQGLSERRSDTVRSHLAGLGISEDLVAAFGYGEFRPIASNESIEGRAKNRRVEIHLSTEPASASSEESVISTNSAD
jgi:outer membrane protein OmpA-like peptidoglycan-associated protein